MVLDTSGLQKLRMISSIAPWIMIPYMLFIHWNKCIWVYLCNDVFWFSRLCLVIVDASNLIWALSGSSLVLVKPTLEVKSLLPCRGWVPVDVFTTETYRMQIDPTMCSFSLKAAQPMQLLSLPVSAFDEAAVWGPQVLVVDPSSAMLAAGRHWLASMALDTSKSSISDVACTRTMFGYLSLFWRFFWMSCGIPRQSKIILGINLWTKASRLCVSGSEPVGHEFRPW